MEKIIITIILVIIENFEQILKYIQMYKKIA